MFELYLAQWHFNPRQRPLQQALADSQTLHRLVMSAFPQAIPGDEARRAFGVLYRLEIDDKTGVPALLLQAAVRPDMSPLAPLLLRPPAEEPKDVSQCYDAIAPGSLLRFRLRANPTRRVHASHADDRLAGQRVDLRTDEQRQEWIVRKLHDAGCELIGCVIRDAPIQHGVREGRRVSHGVAVFDGMLRVVDPPLLQAAIRQGVGTGKAYGFGLLSVAPARE